jgi:polysaccharide biosynthesis transport protein
MQPSNARMVDPAEKPLFPYRPNVPLTTFFGTLGGFTLALVWAAVRGGGNRHVEYPGQTRMLLDAPELGVIPSARIDSRLIASGRANTAGLIGNTQHGPVLVPKGVSTAMWFSGSSLVAESVRSIRTSLLFRQESPALRVFVITSLSPAHGKTSLVSNLGIAMTEVGKRVLVIDADLRCPSLHRTLGVSGQKGLTNILDSGAPPDEQMLRELVQPTVIPNLHILASGKGGSRPASVLFHLPAMAQLIDLVRDQYDLVLIDTPPLILSEARILGPLADGVILVLRAGAVKLEALLAAEQRLVEDGSHVLGTVLNDWDPRSNGYGYYPDRYHKESYYQAAHH